jgi:membrane protein
LEQIGDFMIQLIAFIPFLLMSIVFITHMRREPRGMVTGVLFLIYLITIGATGMFTLFYYSELLQKSNLLYTLVMISGIIFIVAIALFPFILIITYFIQGILILKKEGLRLKNVLSLAFSIALVIYIFVWPLIMPISLSNIYEKPLLLFADIIYKIFSFIFLYLLFLMAMYCVSAILNLIHIGKGKKMIHIGKGKNLDYIIVLGAGIKGKQVTPLLASRIDKGIELLKYNPNAKLILSGGMGPGEDIPEGVAMADYAKQNGVYEEKIIIEDKSKNTYENLLFSSKLMDKENPKIALVTTSYHVFRALVFAKKLNIPCIGYGSKTKWYFTLNALIREYIGYLSISYKFHMLVVLFYTIAMLLITLFDYLNKTGAINLKDFLHP